MMDPGPHPPDSELRDFSRRVRDATGQETKRTRDEVSIDLANPAKCAEFLALLDELRQADEELRSQNDELFASRQLVEQERAKYRELFEFAPDAYLVTDVNGIIREANIAAERLLGVRQKFLIGKPVQAFFDESARNKYQHPLDQLCHCDCLDDWDLWLSPRGSERVPVAISLGRAGRKHDGTPAYQWLLRDISRRKQAEDALRELNRDLEMRVAARTSQLAAANLRKDQLIYSERRAREEAEIADRLKSDFLAVLSHEFRTPLQAIFGYTELLEREIHGPLTKAQRRDLNRIQESQQHLLGLINTILDFAQLDSGGGADVRLTTVAVDQILSNVEGFIGSQLETKDLHYSYRTGDGTIVAIADGAKLEQIVVNLLANAIRFTPSGGSIALECANDDDRVRISVSDTGIGIPPDKLDAIFEPFVQIRARGAAVTGTGLGLPISRRLAMAMGGELTAVSEQGNGSTFTLSLRAHA